MRKMSFLWRKRLRILNLTNLSLLVKINLKLQHAPNEDPSGMMYGR